ncbi:MAG TPA: cupredoxin domain-containing protein [Actinomycetota bacterium]|jgi:plastocyanin
MTTRISARRLLRLALAGSLLLAACGGNGDGDGADGADPEVGGSAVSTITLTDNAYTPADPVVAAGTVELVNDGEAPHTFTIEGEDVDVEVGAGESATAAIDLDAGAYTLFCEFHRAQGMETTLTVR